MNRIIGKHGVGNVNSNGLCLLYLCSEFDLIITNTLFQERNQCKTTWMHPRSKHWHLLDYVIVRRSDCRDVQLTDAMRGAECWTDHRLVRASIQLNIRSPICKRNDSMSEPTETRRPKWTYFMRIYMPSCKATRILILRNSPLNGQTSATALWTLLRLPLVSPQKVSRLVR